MTQCYLVYINPALPASIMILRFVPPPILDLLNQVAGMYFVIEHRDMCKICTCTVNT